MEQKTPNGNAGILSNMIIFFAQITGTVIDFL